MGLARLTPGELQLPSASDRHSYERLMPLERKMDCGRRLKSRVEEFLFISSSSSSSSSSEKVDSSSSVMKDGVRNGLFLISFCPFVNCCVSPETRKTPFKSFTANTVDGEKSKGEDFASFCWRRPSWSSDRPPVFDVGSENEPQLESKVGEVVTLMLLLMLLKLSVPGGMNTTRLPREIRFLWMEFER